MLVFLSFPVVEKTEIEKNIYIFISAFRNFIDLNDRKAISSGKPVIAENLLCDERVSGFYTWHRPPALAEVNGGKYSRYFYSWKLNSSKLQLLITKLSVDLSIEEWIVFCAEGITSIDLAHVLFEDRPTAFLQTRSIPQLSVWWSDQRKM